MSNSAADEFKLYLLPAIANQKIIQNKISKEFISMMATTLKITIALDIGYFQSMKF
jgi:hypothetical protein